MSVTDPGGNSPFHFTITSDTANLAGLREAITSAAIQIGFIEPALSHLVLAVDEAVSNVIKHGYEGCCDQPIEFCLEPVRRGTRLGLQVTISDLGRQVDPDKILGRPLDEVRPGGLGTHIIRNVMDEVEYSVRQPQGMCLRMLKLRDGNGEDSVNA